MAFIDDNIILAGTEFHGICVSTNGGEFFESKALFDLNIRSIVTSGENIFVASYLSNIFKSTEVEYTVQLIWETVGNVLVSVANQYFHWF